MCLCRVCAFWKVLSFFQSVQRQSFGPVCAFFQHQPLIQSTRRLMCVWRPARRSTLPRRVTTLSFKHTHMYYYCILYYTHRAGGLTEQSGGGGQHQLHAPIRNNFSSSLPSPSLAHVPPTCTSSLSSPPQCEWDLNLSERRESSHTAAAANTHARKLSRKHWVCAPPPGRRCDVSFKTSHNGTYSVLDAPSSSRDRFEACFRNCLYLTCRSFPVSLCLNQMRLLLLSDGGDCLDSDYLVVSLVFLAVLHHRILYSSLEANHHHHHHSPQDWSRDSAVAPRQRQKICSFDWSDCSRMTTPDFDLHYFFGLLLLLLSMTKMERSRCFGVRSSLYPHLHPLHPHSLLLLHVVLVGTLQPRQPRHRQPYPSDLNIVGLLQHIVGRRRRQPSWESNSSDSSCCSILLRPRSSQKNQIQQSAAVAAAAAAAVGTAGVVAL